jgi:hypothetical protein
MPKAALHVRSGFVGYTRARRLGERRGNGGEPKKIPARKRSLKKQIAEKTKNHFNFF